MRGENEWGDDVDDDSGWTATTLAGRCAPHTYTCTHPHPTLACPHPTPTPCPTPHAPRPTPTCAHTHAHTYTHPHLYPCPRPRPMYSCPYVCPHALPTHAPQPCGWEPSDYLVTLHWCEWELGKIVKQRSSPGLVDIEWPDVGRRTSKLSLGEYGGGPERMVPIHAGYSAENGNASTNLALFSCEYQ